MGHQLCIDLGNTKGKAAIFENNELLNAFQFETSEVVTSIQDIIATYAPEKAILSSVINHPEALNNLLNDNIKKVIVLNNETRLPIVNAYSSPETLGMDRIALVAAANHLHPENDNLVICMGSATTYNFIAKNRFFRGGAIAPGVGMRFSALNDYTDKLPLVNPKGELLLIGYDTESSIRSGVLFGVKAEVEAMIEQYQQKYPNIVISITGGYYPYFDFKVKNQIFADAHLLLKGLNIILNYNA